MADSHSFHEQDQFRKQEESIPSLYIVSGEFKTQDAVKKCFDFLSPEAQAWVFIS